MFGMVMSVRNRGVLFISFLPPSCLETDPLPSLLSLNTRQKRGSVTRLGLGIATKWRWLAGSVAGVPERRPALCLLCPYKRSPSFGKAAVLGHGQRLFSVGSGHR